VLFVPSLINPPTILDLSEERSLLRWLANGAGRRVLLLDWGWPGEARKTFDVADHVEQILLPLAESLEEPADLVGYCLGGTMAAAAARRARARSLVTIAAPWRFDGFPDEARAKLAALWRDSRPAVAALGLLPMEVLQSAFWSLDPARTVAKFEAFAEMAPDSAEARTFVTLEDWANDGPPVSGAAAREMFEDFFAADLPGRGAWEVSGEPVRPEALGLPVLDIVSTSDRIVPAATAMAVGERLELAQGHVGMVVGSKAKEALWEPLAAWLSRPAAQC
jgi:polyhydroxyalkanoate synthase